MFPVFVVASVLENLIRMMQGKCSIRVNETVGSLSQGIFQECLRIHVRSIELIMYCIVWNNFRIVTLPWNSLWTWWLCYLAVDFGFYWAHRFAHEVNFIWAVHQAHHSSEEFSFVSALRQAVLQPFTAWVSMNTNFTVIRHSTNQSNANSIQIQSPRTCLWRSSFRLRYTLLTSSSASCIWSGYTPKSSTILDLSSTYSTHQVIIGYIIVVTPST